MLKKIFKSSGLVIGVLIFVILPTGIAGAADVISSNLVPCDGVDCSLCSLVQMVNTIILWLFGIIFLIFAVIMFIAGWGLITSGGNQVALNDAKTKFQNALIGLLIVMAAWLLIDSIMKGLLGGAGEIDGKPWSQVQCQTQIDAKKWIGDPDTDPDVVPLAGPKPATCGGATCQALDQSICKSASSCSISPDLAAKISAFHAAAGVGGARVTEAMPPTRDHKSPCHTNGTCIDYSKSGGMTPDEVLRTINAAKSNGLRPVYEVQTKTQMDNLVKNGVPADSVKVLGSWISAPHFSIYGS